MNSSLTPLVPQRTHVNQTGLNSQKELKAKSRHQEVKKNKSKKTGTINRFLSTLSHVFKINLLFLCGGYVKGGVYF
jgi:hypothetical protein